MKQDRQKRSYGYAPRAHDQRRTTRRGDVPQQPTQKRQRSTAERQHRGQHPLVTLLFFPFRLLWWMLRFVWRLWGRRPRLNGDTHKAVRKRLWQLILTGGIFCFLLGTLMVAWVSRDLPDPDKLTDRRVAQSTKIYDRTGEELLYEIFAEEKRTLVDLDDIPQALIDGAIATEDTAFYEHNGIRPFSILRSFATGRGGGGASTLTQQLVKNAILTPERTITRKLKEIILSLRLEQKYSKEQILKIYFNEIPYGSTNYGVQAAAQSYFGKDVSELTLAESAILAGIPKAPTRYLRNKEAMKNRRDFVLERMVAEEFISREEADAAQAEEIALLQSFGDIRAPHFALHVKGLLVEQYGEQRVDTGGLRVITSLDWEKQQIAETAVAEESETRFEEANADNASLIAIDPTSGHILAMVGSRDFSDEDIDGQFNVATLGKRQPGSSFKPIVYTAAFEKGYTPSTVLFDVVTNFAASGQSYEPKNYDLQEHGLVTMRKAIQGSLNIPAVKALYLVGEKAGVAFAERLGYSTLSTGDFGLSLVLGGGEVHLLEHVSAYGVFANDGVRHEPVSILRVEDSTGDILYEWKQARGDRVLDKEVAATISNILSDDNARAYAFGTGGILTLPGRPVAAKTGTTNAYVDAWTVGYTPKLVAGVWAGNTDNTPMTRGFGGSKVAAPIWNRFMRDALADAPVDTFPEPPKNDATKPVLLGSQGGGITLNIDRLTGKRATTSTPPSYIVERTYIPPHTILHYVDKDDPRGPIPPDPTRDPQYDIWEAALQQWITRKREEEPEWDVSFEEPPTEYDDVHSLELIPSLEVVFPRPSSTLRSRQLDTDIRASAPRGVAKVIYKIDGRLLTTVREHPFNLNYYARELENGNHVLNIIVEDDIGNRRIEDIPFTLVAGEEPPSVRWTERRLTLSSNEFPRTLFLRPFKAEQIERVTISQERNGARTALAQISDLSTLLDGQLLWRWEYPGSGTVTLIVETTDRDGITRETDRVTAAVE